MLSETGVEYLRAAVSRDEAADMSERTWEVFAQRGVVRDDASTWPGNGFQVKVQQLRKTRIFRRFGNDAVKRAIAGVLGDDWHEFDPWGAALISFPVRGPWTMPTKNWHSDLPPRGPPDKPAALRLFGFVSDVRPQGGGTLVIEGSHELIRRMVAASPGHNAGSSATVRKQLRAEYPWFKAPSFEPTEIDGVRVCVRELTGAPGDVVLMLPWTLHNISTNCADQPRFMVTHTAYASGGGGTDGNSS